MIAPEVTDVRYGDVRYDVIFRTDEAHLSDVLPWDGRGATGPTGPKP